MKVRDENENNILNIINGNNQFELVDLFENVSTNMDISTNDENNDTKKIIHVLWTQMMNKKHILQNKKDLLRLFI